MRQFNFRVAALFFITTTILSCKMENKIAVSPIDYVALLRRMPDKEIVVIACERPYERELSFPTIISLPDKYLMYYIVYNGLGEREFSTCYAESKDGINWTKPNIGTVEFSGELDNNIISNEFEGISVEYHDGTFYLLTYAADFKTYLYKSSDGKAFSKIESFNIPYCCDTQNQIIWDDLTNRYKLYLRSWYKSENKNIIYNHTDSLYRSVSLLETNNPEAINLTLSGHPLYRWGYGDIPPALSDELPIVMRNTGNDDYDIYNSCVHKYGKNTYIAYPIIYWHFPDISLGGATNNDGYARIGMWSSSDGVNFHAITNDYFNAGNMFFEFALGHIETDNEIIHYYVKFNKTHGDEA